MNDVLFLLKSALNDFRRNKLRTLLTSLGILIGIFSVVLLSALGLGLKKYLADQLRSLGSNLVMVIPGRAFQGGFRPGGGMSGGTRFDDRDLTTVRKIKGISIVIPVFSKYLRVEGPNETKIYEVLASSENVFDIFNFEIDLGTMIAKSDVDKKNKVAVLGINVADKLFGNDKDVINKTIKISDQNFKVIGVLKKKGGGFGGATMDDFVTIPHTAAISFNPNKTFVGLYAKADNEEILPAVKEDIKKALLKRYEEDDFSVADQNELLTIFTSIFQVLNFILIGIAAISLVVGGVGIMNIMYVSVVERVKEIGIRRAYGATKRNILMLFLAESITLSILGGILGLSLSYVVVLAIQKFFPAYIDLNSVLIALGVSSIIGTVFGVFPARKAAALTPIEAIRHE